MGNITPPVSSVIAKYGQTPVLSFSFRLCHQIKYFVIKKVKD